jgi:hypothetical protein
VIRDPTGRAPHGITCVAGNPGTGCGGRRGDAEGVGTDRAKPGGQAVASIEPGALQAPPIPNDSTEHRGTTAARPTPNGISATLLGGRGLAHVFHGPAGFSVHLGSPGVGDRLTRAELQVGRGVIVTSSPLAVTDAMRNVRQTRSSRVTGDTPTAGQFEGVGGLDGGAVTAGLDVEVNVRAGRGCVRSRRRLDARQVGCARDIRSPRRSRPLRSRLRRRTRTGRFRR